MPNEPEAGDIGAEVPNAKEGGPSGKKHSSARMKAMACIQEPGGAEDVVQALDLSRTGITFHGSQPYEVNSWINLAVPYMPGAANIFVAGRIASRKDLPDGQFEYAVQYVKD